MEWKWGELGQCGKTTKEMGSGTQHDTLDDFFGHWNHVTNINMREFTCSDLGCI